MQYRPPNIPKDQLGFQYSIFDDWLQADVLGEHVYGKCSPQWQSCFL